MYETGLLAFGTLVALLGVYVLTPWFGPRCNGPMTAVVLGVLSLGAVDPVVRALGLYDGHLFEALGGGLVLVGLFVAVRRNLGSSNWPALFETDHRAFRTRREWMDPMDDQILEFLADTEIVITPALIAYNTGYSREAVNRRLLELRERGYVDRLEHGKYRITSAGDRYLRCTDLEQSGETAIDVASVSDD